jgi:hypothetical protein
LVPVSVVPVPALTGADVALNTERPRVQPGGVNDWPPAAPLVGWQSMEPAYSAGRSKAGQAESMGHGKDLG